MSLSIGRTVRNYILILPSTIFLSEKYFSLRLSEVLNKIKLFEKVKEPGSCCCSSNMTGMNKEPVDRIQQNNKINAKAQALNLQTYKPLMTIFQEATLPPGCVRLRNDAAVFLFYPNPPDIESTPGFSK